MLHMVLRWLTKLIVLDYCYGVYLIMARFWDSFTRLLLISQLLPAQWAVRLFHRLLTIVHSASTITTSSLTSLSVLSVARSYLDAFFFYSSHICQSITLSGGSHSKCPASGSCLTLTVFRRLLVSVKVIAFVAEVVRDPRPNSRMSKAKAAAKGKKRAQRATSNVFAMFDQAQIQEFKEAFNMIDQNHDGFIDKEDLQDMLASLGVQLLPFVVNCSCVSQKPNQISAELVIKAVKYFATIVKSRAAEVFDLFSCINASVDLFRSRINALVTYTVYMETGVVPVFLAHTYVYIYTYVHTYINKKFLKCVE